MSVSLIRMAGLGLLMVASPVLAQPGPGGPRAESGMAGRGMAGQGMAGRGMGRDTFAGLSEAGRSTMREAMRAGGDDRRAAREQVKAARDRMLTVLEADRLDTAALKRAMDDEKRASSASHDRRQTAMLAAFQKLSLEDRKAFVTGARASRERMTERAEGFRERMRERRTMRSGAPSI